MYTTLKNKSSIELENGILKIKDEFNNTEEIDIKTLEYNKKYESTLQAGEKKEILFVENYAEDNIETDDVIAVYADGTNVNYIYCNIKQLYGRLVKVKNKVLKINLNKKRVKFVVLAFIVNEYNLEITNQKIYVDDEIYINCKLNQYSSKISKSKMLKDKNIYTYSFDMNDIINDNSEINGVIRYALKVNGNDIGYRIGIKNEKNSQHYYAPIKSMYVNDFAIHIRRTVKGNLTLVKRKKEEIENTIRFKLLENKFISKILYNISKIMIKLRKKKINVFYEKFSSKAEEGTYDLFLLIQGKDKNTKNYFVISEDSEDYNKIKENKGVVKKYSLKYYWIIYNANNFISTEAPIHLNIIRSNNASLRKSLTDKPFIFLQHGVTYMKCQGKNSTFTKGKEGQASYIVAGSEKEKNVIEEMFDIDDEHVLKTGLPIFSKIDYKHINNNSDDYIMVMLTWKPYEEQLYNFEESGYYKNTIEICNMLKKYINSDKILIISHPKAYDLITKTDLKDSIWNKPISEALEKSKILITDYSSVCYNSFYQGAGVIFYQPDLEKYEQENGKLIPSDDEYIGKRAFNIEQLEEIIKDTVKDNKINLEAVRTEEYEKQYNLINEFHDGKNIQRIYDELIKLKII